MHKSITGHWHVTHILEVFQQQQRALVLALLPGIVAGSIKCSSWALAATAAVFANLTKDQTKSGTIFQDCPVCPQMVVIPAGRFMMGSPETDEDARDNERPQREVTIARPFAVSRFEVTFAEWNTCVDAGGCVHRPNDAGCGQGSRPVMNVSWEDITEQYLPWLRSGNRPGVSAIDRGRMGVRRARRNDDRLLMG